MNYAVSMGNSTLGRHSIDILLDKGVPAPSIRALTRNTARAQDLAHHGVTVNRGEYGDDNSFKNALEGGDRLYMISGTAPPEERIRQHRGIIDAANWAGVTNVVYTSFIDTADDSPFFAWKVNKAT